MILLIEIPDKPNQNVIGVVVNTASIESLQRHSWVAKILQIDGKIYTKSLQDMTKEELLQKSKNTSTWAEFQILMAEIIRRLP